MLSTSPLRNNAQSSVNSISTSTPQAKRSPVWLVNGLTKGAGWVGVREKYSIKSPFLARFLVVSVDFIFASKLVLIVIGEGALLVLLVCVVVVAVKLGSGAPVIEAETILEAEVMGMATVEILFRGVVTSEVILLLDTCCKIPSNLR